MGSESSGVFLIGRMVMNSTERTERYNMDKKIILVVPNDLAEAEAEISEGRVVTWRTEDGTVIELHDGRAEADK